MCENDEALREMNDADVARCMQSGRGKAACESAERTRRVNDCVNMGYTYAQCEQSEKDYEQRQHGL